MRWRIYTSGHLIIVFALLILNIYKVVEFKIFHCCVHLVLFFFFFIPTEREVLAANRVEGVEDLAYDWISKNLYWTDPRYRSISVMKVADKSRRAIIRNLNNPRSIVVHPIVGWVKMSLANRLYWVSAWLCHFMNKCNFINCVCSVITVLILM